MTTRKNKNDWCLLLAAMLLAVPAVSVADDSMYGALMGSVVINDPSRSLEEGFGAHALFGYKLNPKIALEPNAFWHRSDFESPFNLAFDPLDIYGAGLDVNLLGDGVPFYLAGVGVRKEDFQGFTKTRPFINLGIGMTVPELSLGRARLRAEARWIVVFDDQSAPQEYFRNDFRFNLGLMFGGAAAPVAAAPAVAAIVDGDADKDGVSDSRDQCPNSTAGATVDMRGCEAVPVVAEKDSDGDGVMDSADECPGTAKGLTVDGRGCVALESFVLKGVSFDFNSANLKAGAESILDSAVSALKKVPAGTPVEIGGHTDSIGSPDSNKKLSQARAESVRAYLIGKGVSGDALTAKGYGSDKPVDDNKTAAGRANNRRVEFKIGD